ncbi:hypothetical protein [uncultured Campylobacter sp.]|nr:hypothetical protein [uncultured Campylobacter sp.]
MVKFKRKLCARQTRRLEISKFHTVKISSELPALKFQSAAKF